MAATVSMDKLRAAGIPAEIAALIIQLARQAERPQLKGDPGPKGDPGVAPQIRAFTDPAEAEAEALAHPEDIIILYQAG